MIPAQVPHTIFCQTSAFIDHHGKGNASRDLCNNQTIIRKKRFSFIFFNRRVRRL